MELRCWFDNSIFYVEISDWGKPFNILESKDPDISADLDTRSIGGVGIWIVKNLSDRIDYKRVDDKNVVKIAFKVN